MRKNSTFFTLSNQTIEAVENFYRDIAGFDMRFDEIKDIFGEAWKMKDYNYLHIDRSKKEIEGRYSFLNENNPNMFVQCKLKTTLFQNK